MGTDSPKQSDAIATVLVDSVAMLGSNPSRAEGNARAILDRNPRHRFGTTNAVVSEPD